MKFLFDTAREFGISLACGFFIFGVAFCFSLLIVMPFAVPLYVDSLVAGNLAVHWILLLTLSTFFVEVAIVRAIEGD